ncbi:orotate phosphoribosyltransferase [Ochrovirga pacifica]|uniref:orotate phosphoribosyltransferase n=1 Tax=Ochrovirga pacifica TaxID=1042376 RepID=UPI000255A4E8|nr:orotate phosphoribosyltransferase [Ochrovirga pacifica]
MKLETKTIEINKSKEELYSLFTELKNFEQIMPSNKEKFTIDGDSFILGLYGIPEIRMIIKEKQPYDKIVLSAASSKLDFNLTLLFNEVDVNTTQAQLLFEGNFNPMVSMMVKTPLTNFINELSSNLQKI